MSKIINVFDRLRCPVCQRFYLNKDYVLVDILNTVIHLKCYKTNHFFEIKDRGRYQEIVEKYKFE